MTEPSSPLHDGPGISGYGHSYLYSYSPADAQNHATARRGNETTTDATTMHDRFAKSATTIGSEETPRPRGREPVSSRGAGASSVATMSSPTSLFTIDSILAPRPIGNVVSPASNAATTIATTTTVAASVIQTPETIVESAAGRTTATMHPLQQQLHHLAFTSADFLGRCARRETSSLFFRLVWPFLALFAVTRDFVSSWSRLGLEAKERDSFFRLRILLCLLCAIRPENPSSRTRKVRRSDRASCDGDALESSISVLFGLRFAIFFG